MRHAITLVGDGVENPWNARTMIDAAGMFGVACLFRDRAGLAALRCGQEPLLADLCTTSIDDVARDYAPIVAFDTLDGADDVYGFRLPPTARPAVCVGNERRGLAHDVRALASCKVQIPLASRTLNSLNVAAASAVALYYLGRGGGRAMEESAHPNRRRPELLMLGPGDHVELGSSLRSAAAFGWERVFLDDRHGVWFGCDRGTRAEGRAAARRVRNSIRVIPAGRDRRYPFAEVCVITARGTGTPLHRARLAGGAVQLIVVPDESCVDLDGEQWDRLGRRVSLVHLDLPRQDFTYHYRLVATIALAEMVRQVGRQAAGGGVRRRRPSYDSTLTLVDVGPAETVPLDDLAAY